MEGTPGEHGGFSRRERGVGAKSFGSLGYAWRSSRRHKRFGSLTVEGDYGTDGTPSSSRGFKGVPPGTSGASRNRTTGPRGVDA